ncbi:hypothetical protein HZH66_004608 [Vespula vulgaris]|uniref:Uncharacterized protein n=1 Tax=Vespula vulgaris TaxID=7454 RepID=A0A834KAR9_VESVU|nr:hypothetical protein HZH66_004608 [Vespula vulgaris]
MFVEKFNEIFVHEKHEPFKAQCYPWQIPKGHSYLPTGVCFVDLNREDLDRTSLMAAGFQWQMAPARSSPLVWPKDL